MATPPDKFAAKFTAALRRCGYQGDLTYDAATFSLRGTGNHIFNLGNAYAVYERAGFFERRGVLKALAISSLEVGYRPVPERFEEALPHLLPRVRDLAYYGLTQLQLDLQGVPCLEIPTRPFADGFAFELAFDGPRSIASIGKEQIDRWDKSFDDVLDLAGANLRALSQGPFEVPAPGLYLSPWQDCHDASRLACLELLHHQKVRGEHIAMVPNRDVLLLTGSDDFEAQAAMLGIAGPALAHERAISGVPLVLSAGGWQRWAVPEENPNRDGFRRLDVLNLGGTYAQQKELLEQQHQRDDVDIYIASFSTAEKNGVINSYCVWGEGVDSLLPRTDVVAFGWNDRPKDAAPLVVPWADVVALFPDLMEPQGWYPEMWRVRTFPPEHKLRELQARAVKV
jgi:hypothetical protein